MASGKRASMREGPLAQLFRKTDEDEQTERDRRERPVVGGPQREVEPHALAGERFDALRQAGIGAGDRRPVPD
mgnify:CR=1 FL=1